MGGRATRPPTPPADFQSEGQVPRVRTHHMRNDPLTREGAPREHQEEMGDGPVVGAQRGAG